MRRRGKRDPSAGSEMDALRKLVESCTQDARARADPLKANRWALFAASPASPRTRKKLRAATAASSECPRRCGLGEMENKAFRRPLALQRAVHFAIRSMEGGVIVSSSERRFRHQRFRWRVFSRFERAAPNTTYLSIRGCVRVFLGDEKGLCRSRKSPYTEESVRA